MYIGRNRGRGEGDGRLWTILGVVVTFETKLQLLSTLLLWQVYSTLQPGQPVGHHLSPAWSLFFSKDVKGNTVTFYEDTLCVATMYPE